MLRNALTTRVVLKILLVDNVPIVKSGTQCVSNRVDK